MSDGVGATIREIEASIQEVVDDSYPDRTPYLKLREEMRLTLLDAHYRRRAISSMQVLDDGRGSKD